MPFLSTSKANDTEWIRVKTDVPTLATVSFTNTDSDERSTTSDEMFEGLAELDCNNSIGGLLYSLGNNRRALGIVSTQQRGLKRIPLSQPWKGWHTSLQ